MPIECYRLGGTIASMTLPVSTVPSAVPLAVEEGIAQARASCSDPSSLDALTGQLAEVAHAIRLAADRSDEPRDVTAFFADIQRALGDLAAAAELSANAVIDSDRPPGARATQVPPTRRARAVSWHLHGLAHALRASRDVCPPVRSAMQAWARVEPPHTDGRAAVPPTGARSGPSM